MLSAHTKVTLHLWQCTKHNKEKKIFSQFCVVFVNQYWYYFSFVVFQASQLFGLSAFLCTVSDHASDFVNLVRGMFAYVF